MSSTTAASTSITYLPDETFISGHFHELSFGFVDAESNEPVDLTTFEDVRWVLFRSGDPNTPLLNLQGVVLASDSSSFIVYIKSDYTKDVSGLFVQQVLLIDGVGNKKYPCEGYVNIKPRGEEENSLTIA